MLRDGYKERLANPQSNIGPLPSLPRQAPSSSSGFQQQQQKQVQPTEDNEPAAMDTTLLKHPFPMKLMATMNTGCTSGGMNTGAPSLPPAPVLSLESNSASRHFLHQPQPQLQRRDSPLASGAFSFGRNAEQLQDLVISKPEFSSKTSKFHATRSLVDDCTAPTFLQEGLSGLSSSSSLSLLTSSFSSGAFGSVSRSTPRWDLQPNSLYDQHAQTAALSNSPRMEDMGRCDHLLSLTSLSSDTSGIWNRRRSDLTAIATTATGDQSSPITGRPGFSSDSVGIKPSDAHPGYVDRYLEAAITIQRAFRRFLVRKRASNNVSTSDILHCLAPKRGTTERRHGCFDILCAQLIPNVRGKVEYDSPFFFFNRLT